MLKASGRIDRWFDVRIWLPAQLLWFVNAVVSPGLVHATAVAERSQQKASTQMRKMMLNLTFLLLTSLYLPFLGAENIVRVWNTLGASETRGTLPVELIEGPASLILQYLISQLFLGNAMQLLRVPVYQILQLIVKCSFVMSETALTEWMRPLTFDWGFVDAWLLSIVAVAITVSVLVPSTLPVAALFFAARHWVDSLNFQNGNIVLGMDGEGAFTTFTVHKLQIIFSLWFCCMALFFYSICQEQGNDTLNSVVSCPDFLRPTWGVAPGILVLFTVGLLQLVLSYVIRRHAMLRQQSLTRKSLDEEDEIGKDAHFGRLKWSPDQVIPIDGAVQKIQRILEQDPVGRVKALKQIEKMIFNREPVSKILDRVWARGQVGVPKQHLWSEAITEDP